MRVLLLGALALSLVNCGGTSDSGGDSPSPQPSALSQFLELDNPTGTPSAPAHRASAGNSSQSALAGDLQQVTDQIRTIYADAGAFVDGFPAAEENYRAVPRKFQTSADAVRENKSKADADTIRRRLNQMAGQVDEALDRQHARFASLQTAFNQRLESAMKRAPEFEQVCAKTLANPSAAPADRQACSRFQDAETMVKTRADLVTAGFTRLEEVYKETRQVQQDLSAKTLAAASGK